MICATSSELESIGGICCVPYGLEVLGRSGASRTFTRLTAGTVNRLRQLFIQATLLVLLARPAWAEIVARDGLPRPRVFGFRFRWVTLGQQSHHFPWSAVRLQQARHHTHVRVDVREELHEQSGYVSSMSHSSDEPYFAGRDPFASQTPEEKQARTERWRSSLRQGILSDLDYFHKQRWARIAAEIRHRVRSASNEEARARAKDELDTHYRTRFYPETSREALLAEVDTRELPPPGP